MSDPASSSKASVTQNAMTVNAEALLKEYVQQSNEIDKLVGFPFNRQRTANTVLQSKVNTVNESKLVSLRLTEAYSNPKCQVGRVARRCP